MARTKAQQAAVDQLRAQKEAAAQTQFTETKKEFDPAQAAEDIAQKISSMISSALGVEVPSWKRNLAALFIPIALSYGTAHIIGTVAGYAIVGIATLGGGALTAFLIWALAVILSVYACLKIGQHVGGYILSGQIDRDIVATKNKVLGLFGRRELIVAA